MKVKGELRDILIRILEKDKRKYLFEIDKKIKKLKETGETE
jgi:hypothetical protein